MKKGLDKHSKVRYHYHTETVFFNAVDMTGNRITKKVVIMNDIRKVILSNLEGRAHAVSAPCALSGVDLTEGLREIEKMQGEGIVRVEPFLNRNFNSPKMYRLSMGFVNRQHT